MAMKTEVVVFCVLTQCSAVEGYQYFEEFTLKREAI
jgi:hypothetical protein